MTIAKGTLPPGVLRPRGLWPAARPHHAALAPGAGFCAAGVRRLPRALGRRRAVDLQRTGPERLRLPGVAARHQVALSRGRQATGAPPSGARQSSSSARRCTTHTDSASLTTVGSTRKPCRQRASTSASVMPRPNSMLRAVSVSICAMSSHSS